MAANLLAFARRVVLVFGFLVSTTFASAAESGCAGTLDVSFAPAEIFPTAIATDGDGVVVGTPWALVRLRANGSMDIDFTVSVYGTNQFGYKSISVVKKDHQGRWLIGGDLTEVNGFPRPGIARILPSGEVDSSFLSSPEPPLTNGFIRAIFPLTNGKIMVAGFTPGTDHPQSFVRRLNENGSIDPTFSTVLADDIVQALDLQPNGKIIAGGRFTAINGTPRNQLARFFPNGDLDETFEPPQQLLEAVGVTALADGKILAYWSPVAYAAELKRAGPTYPLVRFNADGSVDRTFSDGIVCVADVAIQPDGKYILGGKFLSASDANKYYMRITPDGAPDGNFQTVVTTDQFFYFSGENSKLELDAENRPVIAFAGTSTLVNGVPRQVARLLDDSAPCITTLTFPTNRFVFIETNGAVAIPVFRQGDLSSPSSIEVVSGSFGFPGYVPFKTNLVFAPGVTERTALLPLTDNTRIESRRTFQIYLTNQTPNCVFGPNRLAELSILDASSQFFPGAIDPSFYVRLDLVPNLFAYPGPIVAMPGGKMVIASGFNAVNGIPTGPVARINPDGSLDTSFHYTGTNQPTMIAAAGEKLYMACNGGSKPLVRLLANGSEDASFVAPSFSFEGEPMFRCIAPDSNGNILVVGSFTNINGVGRGYVAKIKADGSVDATFNPLPAAGVSYRESGVIYALPDGTFLLGGLARRVNAELNPLLTHLSATGAALAGYEIPDVPFDRESYLWSVVSILQQSDGSVVIGGDFDPTEGTSFRKLLRFTPSGNLDPTFAAADNIYVGQLLVQADDKIITSGGAVRLNKDGPIDETFRFNEWGYSAATAISGEYVYVRSDFRNFSRYAKPGVLRFRAGSYSGPGVVDIEPPEEFSIDAETATVFVRRTVSSAGEARVRLRTRDVNSVSGRDYVATDALVTFADGEGGSKPVSIPLLKCTYSFVFEVNLMAETAGLALPEYGAYGAARLVTVRSFEEQQGFYMEDTSWRWANEDEKQAIVSIRRSHVSAQPTSVELVIGAGGDAVPGVDFVPATNRIEFAAGEVDKAVYIPLLNDDVVEPDKTLVVKIQNPSEGSIFGYGTNIISIRDNADEIEFLESPIETVQENGVARLLVQPLPLYSGKPARNVTLAYQTDGGTAQPGVEYLPQQGEITLWPGASRSFEILVPLLRNSIVGEPTTIRVTIKSLTPEVVITNATATIILRHPPAVFSPGSVDPNFVLQVPYPFWPTSIAEAGGFIYASEWSIESWRAPSRLARYFANGVWDESFQLQGLPTVSRVLSLPSNQFLALLESGGMARFNGNGSVDPSFRPALPQFLYIYDVLPQPDGKLIVAGSVRPSSSTIAFVRRLNVDGSLDSTFASFEFDYHSNFPVMIALQADGKVLVYRKSTGTDKIGENEFLRLTNEGGLDPTFKDPGILFYAGKIVATPSGKIFVSGPFTSEDGSPFAAVARLNSDGSFDKFVWEASPNQSYASVLIDQQNRIYLSSGPETSIPYKLWRISENGDIDPTFLAEPVGNTIFVTHDALIVASGYGEMTRIFLDSPIAMRPPERLSNGNVVHTFNFPKNTPYVLEETGDFLTWVEVRSGVTADGYVRLETAAPDSTRFYRVRSAQ